MISVKTLNPTIGFASNTYIIESSGEIMIVDPSIEYLQALKQHPECSWGVKFIAVTHCHFDHILTLDEWRERTGATVLVSEADGFGLSDSYRNAYSLFLGVDKGYHGPYLTVSDGQTLKLGNDEFKIISTPGHTGGGISLLFDGHLFVGDTVFADGGYGRYDLPSGDYDTLMSSIRRIAMLPKDIKVYPGHGRSTDIGEIRCFFTSN